MPSFRNPFKRRKATPGAEPDLWVRCPGCSELLFKKTLEKSLRVCSACGHHFRVPARERIAQRRRIRFANPHDGFALLTHAPPAS